MEQYKSLIHEYLLGLRMATRHALWPIKIVVGKIQTIVSPTFSCVDGDDTFIRQPSNNDTETLKLVGVGFGRTGTVSGYFITCIITLVTSFGIENLRQCE